MRIVIVLRLQISTIQIILKFQLSTYSINSQVSTTDAKVQTTMLKLKTIKSQVKITS